MPKVFIFVAFPTTLLFTMKYNISEIIDFNAISAFQQFSLITFIITVIVEIFYGTIVYLTTSKKMAFFRTLTYFYIFECILAEFLMLCWKPYRLFPYTVIYPTGIFAPMSSTFSAFLAAFFPFAHAIFIETLVIVIVERHFLILGNSKFKKARFWVYVFLAITNVATGIPFFMFLMQNINDAEVQSMLKSEIDNVEQILSFQPSLYYLNLSYSSVSWILLFNGLIYAAYRIILIILILKENYKFVKGTTTQHYSDKTRKQFMLMFHSTMVQFCTTMFCSAFAAIWAVTVFVEQNTFGIKLAYYISLGVVICYPIADVIIVITVVKGYRNTVKKLIKVITGEKKRKISGFGFHTIINNNNNNHLNINAAARKASIFVY